MAFEHIIYEIESALATITFNRPKAMNALNGALIEELSLALDDRAGNRRMNIHPLVLRSILFSQGDMEKLLGGICCICPPPTCQDNSSV